MNDLTEAELARAKRYIESVPFEIAEFPTGDWIIKGGPTLFRHVWGQTRDDAVSNMLNAIVEVLASVAPVIAEEERERCARRIDDQAWKWDERDDESAKIAATIRQCAAAIRSMPKRGETC